MCYVLKDVELIFGTLEKTSSIWSLEKWPHGGGKKSSILKLEKIALWKGGKCLIWI